MATKTKTDAAIDGAEQVAEAVAALTGNAAAIPAIQLGAAVLQSAAGAVQTLMAAYESNDPDVLAATMAKVRHANDVLMGNVAPPADPAPAAEAETPAEDPAA